MLTFQSPTINFADSNYFEFIDWSKCELTPPPIMSNVSVQSLDELINTNVLIVFELREQR